MFLHVIPGPALCVMPMPDMTRRCVSHASAESTSPVSADSACHRQMQEVEEQAVLDKNRTDKEITVLVKVFGGLRELMTGELGKGSLSVSLPDGSRVSDLISVLAAQAPMLAERIKSGGGYLNVLLNGRNVRFFSGMDTALFDGATVSILPPIGGG